METYTSTERSSVNTFVATDFIKEIDRLYPTLKDEVERDVVNFIRQHFITVNLFEERNLNPFHGCTTFNTLIKSITYLSLCGISPKGWPRYPEGDVDLGELFILNPEPEIAGSKGRSSQ